MNSESLKCIVLNSSAIIALAAINMLGTVAKLAPKSLVPRAIYEEVVIGGSGKPGSRELKIPFTYETVIRYRLVKISHD